ncbi:MAG: YqaJ viral recombinase family protein [Paraclostridium sp.]
MRRFLDAKVICSTKGMDKEEWIERRRYGIGGSDAAAVVNMNPYNSVTNLYLEKVHNNFGVDIDFNILKSNLENKDLNLDEKSYRMELGNKLKDFVAREFYLKTNKKLVRVNGILRNDKYPFAIANIDRYVCGERAILMCKTTNIYNKKEWQYQVPIHYQIQCYHYMAVTGVTKCYVAVLVANDELIIHEVEKDEEAIDYVMSEEEKFWKDYVMGDKILLPDGSEEYSNYLKSKYKDSRDEVVNIFISDDKLSRYDEIAMTIKKLDKEKKAIEQMVQSEMGEYEVAFLGDRKVTWKTQVRNSLDTKRLKVDYKDLVSEYTKTSTSRVFRM